ncbi:hypothetical protein [Microbacterium sulfonylureivorans]|uniref:hypothetical protein n=1 Tax=Microbacterium sulfonylureivorans TaxID=2486854 RepID=UPI000FDA79C3|nr:hypothetical protein [Microbacterium sulfonylureivorans]
MTKRECAAASMLALALGLAGCAPTPAFPPTGAHEPAIVEAREAAAAAELDLLHSIVPEPALSTGVKDACTRGQFGPFYNSPSAWDCGHSTMWIIEDPRTDPAEILASWRERLVAAGCEPDEADWGMTEQYWREMGIPGQTANGVPYTVDDLPGASARCPDSDWRYVSFRLSTPDGVDEMDTTVDGELIDASPYDLAQIRASASPHVVTIGTGTGYHEVPRSGETEEVEDDDEPLPCVCHSGGDCDCPGG